MSGEYKYKHLVEVTMIPLNGIYPIIYNLEMGLLATVLDLKQDIIILMQKHNQRMKYLLNGYFKQIEQRICKYNNHKSYLFIVPMEIIDLCGSFYDEYYPMSINVKVDNLTVLSKYERIITNDSKVHTYNPLSSGITRLNVYELLDNELLNKYLQLSSNQIEYKIIRIFHDGHSLVMKLPLNIIIESNTMMNMANDKLKPYIKLSEQNEKDINLFDVYIGENLLSAIDGICVVMPVRIYPIYNESDKIELMMNINNKDWLNRLFYDQSLVSSIQISWHEDVFRNEIFENPADTIKNHVCAIEFDDETDTINQIQTMFD
eukprot:278142_1